MRGSHITIEAVEAVIEGTECYGIKRELGEAVDRVLPSRSALLHTSISHVQTLRQKKHSARIVKQLSRASCLYSLAWV
jgi:hypothetical protein